MAKITLKEFFRDQIGPMKCVTEFGYVESKDSPVNGVILEDVSGTDKSCTGFFDFSRSEFAEYPWLREKCPASLTWDGASFTALAGLDPSAFSLDISPLKASLSSVSLLMENQCRTHNVKHHGNADVWESRSYLVLEYLFHDCCMENGEPFRAEGKYLLFQGGAMTTFRTAFTDAAGSEGVPVSDCLSMLPAMLGFQIDFAAYLPESVTFSNEIRLYGLEFSFRSGLLKTFMEAQSDASSMEARGDASSVEAQSDASSEARVSAPPVEQVSVSIGFSGDLFSGGIPCVSVLEPRIRIHWQRERNLDLQVFGNLILGDPKRPLLALRTAAGFPRFDLEATGAADLKLTDVTDYYLGYELPEAFSGLKLSQAELYACPGEKSFYAGLMLKDLFRVKISERAGFSFDMAHVCLSYEQEELSAGLDARMALQDRSNGQDKTLLVFLASAVLRREGVALKAQFANAGSAVYGYEYQGDSEISVNRVIEALFDTSLPDGFPQVFLLEAGIGFMISGGSGLKDLAADFGVEVRNWEVLGRSFNVSGEIHAAGNEIRLKTALKMDDFISLNAELISSAGELKLGCTLDFDGFEIAFTYEKKEKECIRGRIGQKGYTLGRAAAYLTELMHPGETVVKSSDWAFLDKISLEQVELVYYPSEKKLEIWVGARVTLPFLRLEKAGLQMDSSGVRFLIAGEFLGERYDERKPLSWDTQSAPPAAGGAVHVDYFALSEHVRIQTDKRSVEENLALIQTQIAADRRPEHLSAGSGKIMGLSCQIAETVDCKLVYNSDCRLCGGRFWLYGERAGKLKGLTAELMYTKVNDTVGVFSAKVVPSQALRNIDLGGIRIGLGNIGIQVYTNGDFSLDMGFPHDRNFGCSFSLQYGIFSGSGGILISRDTLGSSKQVPTSTKGYFSPVLACGIGLRLGLSKGFSIGILSASVSLTMTGIFQGVYATFLPYGGGESRPYYRVQAWVEVCGCLNGNVNFGIIGAGVSVEIRTSADLTLESEMPTGLHLDLYVSASAYVKVLWWKISFAFSLNFGLDFELGSGGRPFWRGALTSEKLCVPQNLKVSGWNEQRIIPLYLVPVCTAAFEKGRYRMVLFTGMSREDFALLVQAVTELAAQNGYPEETHGMELFDRRPFFGQVSVLESFLEQNVRFVLYDYDKSAIPEDGMVLMPMPFYVTQEVTLTVSGNAKTDTVNLETDNPVDAAYFFGLRSYYRDMAEESGFGENGDMTEESETRSMSAYLFYEYFEIILRAARAQQEHLRQKGKTLDLNEISREELDNLIGMTQRFLFGGKRALETLDSGRMMGAYERAGCQFVLDEIDHLEAVRVCLRKNEQAPVWFSFAEQGQAELVSALSLSEIMSFLPETGEPRFEEGYPMLLPFFGHARETRASLGEPVNFEEEYRLYPLLAEAGEGCAVRFSDAGGFAVTLSLTLSCCREGIPVYTLTGYGEFERLGRLFKAGIPWEDVSVEFAYREADGQNEYERWGGGLWIGVNSLFEENRPVTKAFSREDGECAAFAALKEDPALFLELLYASFCTNGRYFLGSSEGCLRAADEEQEILLILRFPAEKADVYHTFFNGIWQPCSMREEPQMWLDMESFTERIRPGRMVCRGMLLQEAAGGNSESMALWVTDSAGRAVSGESIPVFAREEGGRSLYEMTVPLYRFLDPEDVYAGVAQGLPYHLNFFQTDILGNASGVFGEFSVVPKYSDTLLSPTAYSGLKISFSLVEEDGQIFLVLVMLFEPGDCDADELAYAVHQLEQNDVALWISSSLMMSGEETRLYKEPLLAFLRSCRDASTGERMSAEQRAGVCDLKEMTLVRGEAEILIRRDPSLCREQTPECVREVRAALSWYEPEEKLHLMGSLRRSPLHNVAAGYGIWKSGQEFFALCGSGPLAELSEPECWAYVSLPVYTGTLTDGEKSISVNEMDLERIWNDFRSDVGWMTDAERMASCVRDGKSDYLQRLMKIRLDAAAAVSRRAAPVCGSGWGDAEVHSAVGKNMEALMRDDFQASLTERLFLHADCSGALVDCAGTGYDRVNYYGSIPALSSTPFRIPLTGAAAWCDTAVPVQEEGDSDEWHVSVNYLELVKGETSVWLSPAQPECWELPLNRPKVWAVLDRSVPVSPVLLQQVYEEENHVMQIGISLGAMAGDEMLIRWRKPGEDGKKHAEAPEGLVEMYHYDQNREECVRKEDMEGLLVLMEEYAAGLGRYETECPEKGRQEEADLIMLFTGENGSLTALTPTKEQEGLKLYYRLAGSAETELVKEEGSYRFREKMLPAEGEAWELRIMLPSGSCLLAEVSMKRRQEGVNPLFVRRSATVYSGS